MPETVPYPVPLSGPPRLIAEALNGGMLSPADADSLLREGLSESQVGLHVQDLDWWRRRRPRNAPGLRLPWIIQAWDAALRLSLPGMDLWIDPGPSAPLPETAPDLIFVTHAHHDHTARLAEFAQSFPGTRIVMTAETAELLRLLDDGGRTGWIDRQAVQMTYNRPRTLLDVDICLLPAGHLYGAAMLSLHYGPDALLVTGDFALREVGGLPGAALPEEPYGLVLMAESSLPGRGDLPLADLASTRQPLLQKTQALLEQGKSTVIIPAQSLGQAQEVYAALVTAQRAGAFTEPVVRLYGLAAEVADLYADSLRGCPGPWKLPFERVLRKDQPDSLIITPIQYGLHSRAEAEEAPLWLGRVSNPPIYTHASWAEHVTLAMLVACDRIAAYHGSALSLNRALDELGRKVLSLPLEC